MEAEAIKIDEYLGSDVGKRFDFLYENYSVIKPIINNFKEDLVSDVYEMKTYNRRAANGDLGVRIQISIGMSNPTADEAMKRSTITKAIDDGYLDDEFFEDTDDPQDLIRRITIYKLVSADYKEFKKKLDEMNPFDQRVIKPYILKEKSMNELSEEMGIEYRSAVMKVYRIRKKLSGLVIPKLKRGA